MSERWCSTCGKTLTTSSATETECPICKRWWIDNPPPADQPPVEVLGPCPFCRKTDNLRVSHPVPSDEQVFHCRVVCDVPPSRAYRDPTLCRGVSGPVAHTEAEAVALWNASQPPAPGLDEATVERVALAIAESYNPGLFDGDEVVRHRAASPHSVHHSQAVEMKLARDAARAAILAFPATVKQAG